MDDTFYDRNLEVEAPFKVEALENRSKYHMKFWALTLCSHHRALHIQLVFCRSAEAWQLSHWLNFKLNFETSTF